MLAGESFHDGCNTCMCRKGGSAGCKFMACPDKCRYKNWDLAVGYASKGGVNAYDEKAGCAKNCKCKVKKLGGKISCPKPCVYFKGGGGGGGGVQP